MRKLFFLTTTVILLICTACQGPFVDPGSSGMIGSLGGGEHDGGWGGGGDNGSGGGTGGGSGNGTGGGSGTGGTGGDGGNTVAVTDVTLNKTTLLLSRGSTETLTATVTPNNATNKSVTWTSSDTSKATVSTTGEVTAVAEGLATITVTADGGKTATCEVLIYTMFVTQVTLPASRFLPIGGKEILTATIAPANATNKSVTWTSSDTGIATVSITGEVTAVAEGLATITVTTADGNKTAACKVEVVKNYNIGDVGPGGGKIIYVSTEGFTVQMTNADDNYTAHYLEAAPNDCSQAQWSSLPSYSNANIAGIGKEIGTGRKNTQLLVDLKGYPAASSCNNLTTGGKTDWFLPSLNELWELYKQRSYFDNITSTSYWSSSQYTNNKDEAWTVSFNLGNTPTENKSKTNYVRAVRAF